VFAVYDVSYNLSRVVAAFLAIPMLPALGEAWSVALVGAAFLLWAPVLPRWIGHTPQTVARILHGPDARRGAAPQNTGQGRRKGRLLIALGLLGFALWRGWRGFSRG